MTQPAKAEPKNESKPGRWLLTGTLITTVGNGMQTLAIGKILYDRTGSVAAFGGVIVFEQLLALVLNVFAGPWIDRGDPKRTSILVELLRGGVVCLASLLLMTTSMVLPWIILMSLIIRLCQPFYRAGTFALAPAVVPAAALGRFNGYTNVCMQGGQLVGVALAAPIIGLLGAPVAFLLNGLTFIASAACLALTKAERQPPVAKPLAKTGHLRQTLNDWKEIGKLLRADLGLAGLLVVSAADVVSVNLFNLLLVPLVADRYAGSTYWLSVVDAAFAVGAILAAFAADKLLGLLGARWTTFLGIAAQAAGFALLGLVKGNVATLSLAFLVGAGNTISWTVLVTAVQLKAKGRTKGRIGTARSLLAAAVTGVLVPLVAKVQSHSMTAALVACGVICFTFALLALAKRAKVAPPREVAVCPRSVNLQAVSFVDEAHGWVVGDGGLTLHTKDGGGSWTPQEATSQDLRAVHFVDSNNGWAVGRDGVVLATRDGGAHWRGQASGTTENLYGVHFAADARHGWTVGDAGLVHFTADGGETWTARPTGFENNLLRVTSHGPSHVWVVGTNGLVQASTDQGATWKKQASGTSNDLRCAFFADSLKGWIVGRGGVVLSTTDGGATWARRDSGVDQDLYGLWFERAGGRGWACGDDGVVLTTKDGGMTWQRAASNTPKDVVAMQVLQNGRGWAVGDSGLIIATTNAGESWHAQLDGVDHAMNALHFPNSAAGNYAGWTVGERGKILATTDGGKSWRGQATPTEETLWGVHFAVGAKGGVAVGDNGTLLITKDAGTTWLAETMGLRENLHAVHFASDSSLGIAVGQRGAILISKTGGKSWRSDQSLGQTTWYGVHCGKAGKAWVVGQGGRLAATTDGGEQWQESTLAVKDNLLSVQFTPNLDFGVIVGRGGAVLTTRDQGLTWTAENSGTTATLWGVSIDEGVVVIAGDGGLVLTRRLNDEINPNVWTKLETGSDKKLLCVGRPSSTELCIAGDGGLILTHGRQGWREEVSAAAKNMAAVHFAEDSHTGWAAGDGGTILVTGDGGKTWSAAKSSTTKNLYALHFAADNRRGWAVGRGGVILVTVDGGHRWKEQVSGTRKDLLALYFGQDGTSGWVVGDGGTVLGTTDAGATRTADASGVEQILWGVDFAADQRTGWAVGDGGTVLSTKDAGATWTLNSTHGPKNLAALYVTADGRSGWAVGEAGTTLTTNDGGVNWRRGATGTPKGLAAVHFVDQAVGWAVGRSDTILVTTDGGMSWEPRPSGTGKTLWGVHFSADRRRGWAVGDDGLILATSDGGLSWAVQERSVAKDLDHANLEFRLLA